MNLQPVRRVRDRDPQSATLSRGAEGKPLTYNHNYYLFSPSPKENLALG